MHPVILSPIITAQIAGWQRQAERRAITRAARRARSSPAPRRLHLAAPARRALAPLAVPRRAARAWSRPLPPGPPAASCTGCT